LFAQSGVELVSALVKFYSKEDVSRYMKGLIESYQKQIEQHGDKLGSLMRSEPQAPKQDKKDGKSDKAADGKGKVSSKGWIKMGSMLFNTSDPRTGSTEVIFQIHEEMKQKLARVAESLKSFEEASASIIPEGAQYLLYLRNGVPERLIVDFQDKRASSFAFQGKFKIV
jgi:hypothetical protein